MSKIITITDEARAVYSRLEAYKAARGEALERRAREARKAEAARERYEAAHARVKADRASGKLDAVKLFDLLERDPEARAAVSDENAAIAAEKVADLEANALGEAANKLAAACAARVVLDNAVMVDGKKSHYKAVKAVTDQITEAFPLVYCSFSTRSFGGGQELRAGASWNRFLDRVELSAGESYDSDTIDVSASRIAEYAPSVPELDDIRAAAAAYSEAAAAMIEAVKNCNKELEKLKDSISALANKNICEAVDVAKRWF